ncbi:MAG: BamA/TamA family outer membrane protein [Bacteroidota bacterium]|nr:BamA/TamA family outer membrane protein [Bacteroidota bacterium]
MSNYLWRNKITFQAPTAAALLWLALPSANALPLRRTGQQRPDSVEQQSLEAFPILTYDTDVGFGYGGKIFLLGTLNAKESFDVTLFNSTKGERWYRLVFSIPDFELRQGTMYPLAFDVTIDYDKYLKANLFEPGNFSPPSPHETYTREPLEVSASGSRGFTRNFVATLGIKFKNVRSYYFAEQSRVLQLFPSLDFNKTHSLSLYTTVRFDTRNSFINPQHGSVFQIEFETANRQYKSDFSFFRTTLTAEYFAEVFPRITLASRVVFQNISGSGIPLWAQSSLGGNNTLRGFPMDRFIDNGMSLLNGELRFPIFRRLGGVLFFDDGKVFNSYRSASIKGWHSNAGVGLRFYMDTFVVRFDIGVSNETTGVYFNFGHVF